MILSRTLARRRIADGVHPGWFAAWGPVLADAVLLAGVMALVLVAVTGPLLSRDPPFAVLALVYGAVFFVPVQVVLITSALWAAKSRVLSRDDGNKD
ncbi:hypothetical protein SAMN04488003_11055 [Loktanella fryxellensis]|uniref:Uncharacterized protein n=1 Tax=Loktanella fryxellensis TaxID=245187 RepID=A0A1H8ECV8_9RHOB|nr:hypothetical protein [Loktanella fryxellensis]SEN16578.1 hypothetical protein SAMN04488003_11055 [Loktanella fryxellensis]